MAGVFLSYDHRDVGLAEPIAAALAEAGHSVWWDRQIQGGAEYNSEIESAVERADAVVVLWSERSVRSAWVRDEAAEGRDRGKLVPATLDGVKPPMGFRQYQTIDLSRRRGTRALPRFDKLLDAIEELAPATALSDSPTREAAAEDRQRPLIKWLAILAIVAVLLAAAGMAAWRFSNRSTSIPVVAVAPAAGSGDTEALARDLLVKLGSLRSARTDAVRLIAAPAGKAEHADFIFEVAGSNDPKDAEASLAFLSGKDRAVLWSKDFNIQGGNRTTLEQSMAYTAGQVLDCALQANTSSEARLDEQTLKLFLNGCALFGDRYRADPASVVPIFSQVVAASPNFQPAWSKLLLAEAQSTRGQMMFYDRWAPGGLAEHIRTARKLNPRLPELYVAEAALLPISAFEQRSRLIDQAVRLNPDNPDLLIVRSEFLSGIGRNNDAMDDARRAAELNQLSPGFRSNFIQTLTYADQVPTAEEELRRAEQLWPGSPTIDDARFRLHSRYGDARDALRLVQSPDFRQSYPTQDMEAYLLARINPTDANVERAITAVRSAQLAEGRKLVQLAQLLADFGRIDEIYKMLLGLPPDQVRFMSQVFYRPNFRQFRQDPRFMQLAVRARLVDFWRKSGKWPDFCFEPLPYDCKKEAAKLP
jgi:tetratricopeptide (TPR) repeat protein